MSKHGGLLSVILFVQHIFYSNRVKGDCLDPEVPRYGSRSFPDKHQFKTGDVIHYYCKASYTLVGSPKVYCQLSGNWDTKAPTCIDSCGMCENDGKCVHQPAGDTYYCLCKQGYGGRKCEIPKCMPPNEVYNGGFHVKPPKGQAVYDIGSSVVFYCDLGYMISGINHDIRCVLNSAGSAIWSKAFPVCKARTCKNLLHNRLMPDGKYEPNKKEYSHGDVIRFSCNAGFELFGESYVTCQRSGYWSVVSWPHCSAKRCTVPPPILHGRVIQKSDDFPAGTAISFECFTGKGYYRYGPKQQICVANSNGDMVWHPPRPQCITRITYEQYCAVQRKLFTLEPIPRCINPSQYASDGRNSIHKSASIDTLTIVTGTAGGLLGFLLVIIAFVIYQRRKLMRRIRRTTSRRARSSEDERMLIYCSNDFHFFLPSYDEAVNNRSAQPPSFDDIVNSEEQRQRPSNEGGELSTQERDANATLPLESTEGEYETVENIQSYVNPESTDSPRCGVNSPGNNECARIDANVRTHRAPSEESVVDESEPLV